MLENVTLQKKTRMIKHIVSWQLKEENKAENLQHIQKILEALPAQIAEIKMLEVGVNAPGMPANNWDVVLYSEFDSLQALEIYQVHPAHQEVVQFIKSVVTARSCVDYEV